MKIKQTVLALALMTSSLLGVMAVAPAAHAATCNGVSTAIIECGGDDRSNSNGNVKDNAIWKLLILTLNIMLAGVGVLAVTGVVWAAFLYVSAADSAEQVKKAKGIITNVVIGLVTFGLMWSGLNWLIPGGVFN